MRFTDKQLVEQIDALDEKLRSVWLNIDEIQLDLASRKKLHRRDEWGEDFACYALDFNTALKRLDWFQGKIALLKETLQNKIQIDNI